MTQDIVSYRIVLSYMPITRSQKKQQHQQEGNEYEISFNEECGTAAATRRVKIITPSFLEASTRTYKVYSPKTKPKSGIKKTPTVETETTDTVAAEVLESLQYTTASSGDAVAISCINPMTAVNIYMYRIGIYNISQTLHYKTAYILYDKTSRLYHVYSIISNQIDAQDAAGAPPASETRTEFTLPLPKNTIQFKYTSYVEDTIANFIMTMIVPSNDHDYYIQDDILGLVIQSAEFREKAFDGDSCYYDIEDIMYDNSSSETLDGSKAFMLVPSRHFWYWPASGSCINNTSAYHDNKYTIQTLNSVLTILSCSG
jgi:hypothetical protein